MYRHVFTLLIAISASLGVPLNGWAKATKTLHLEDIMTSSQQRNTGVDDLTKSQKAALERWLTDWTIRVLNDGEFPASAEKSYKDSSDLREEVYTIDEIFDKGEKIKLDDGSFWKVAPRHRKQTQTWKRNQSVILTKQRKQGYTHHFFNLDLGAGVDTWQVTEKDIELELESAEPTKKFTDGKIYSIKDVMRNGERLLLEDGSSWEIAPGDRLNVQAWLPKERVKIDRSGDAIYPHKLVNLEHYDTLSARLLSH
ncbi:MAG: hypothetical protein K0S74_280 [Chlamydiales bacterium]|jgi:hypothetical protein|nr:hypothetical protein [Chlamydiales bacterium]